MGIKRYCALLLSGLLALALCGCGAGPVKGGAKAIAPAELTPEESALAQLLNVKLDGYRIFDFAVGKAGDEENVHKKGMEMIFHQLISVLEKMGVTIEDPAGQSFDPARHSAVMHVDSEELGEGVVSQVFQKGFLLGEKVIRFAAVQVAN